MFWVLQMSFGSSGEEVARLFKVTSYLKHRALLMAAYSAGLRVGEVVRLKVRDIDSQRMQIRVSAGKGAKDRYTLLSEGGLKVLRDYFRVFQAKEWLFPGEVGTNHLSKRSAERIFRDLFGLPLHHLRYHRAQNSRWLRRLRGKIASRCWMRS
jgi:site-specific recombinase XerD